MQLLELFLLVCLYISTFYTSCECQILLTDSIAIAPLSSCDLQSPPQMNWSKNLQFRPTIHEDDLAAEICNRFVVSCQFSHFMQHMFMTRAQEYAQQFFQLTAITSRECQTNGKYWSQMHSVIPARTSAWWTQKCKEGNRWRECRLYL